MPQKIFIFLLLITGTFALAQKQEPRLVLPNGHNEFDILGFSEHLNLNKEETLIFTQGKEDGKCIVWDVKTKKKIHEFKSEYSFLFSQNKFIGLLNRSQDLDSSVSLKIYNTKDLSEVYNYKIVNDFDLIDDNYFVKNIVNDNIILRNNSIIKIVNLLSGQQDTLNLNFIYRNLFSFSDEIIFCGKYKMISFNTKSKEIKELLNLSDKKIEMEDFVFDSTNLQIYFQEVIQNINDNNKSVELKVINLKNGNILNNKLNFPVDNAFHIGMDERGIYYKTSYYKEKSPTENGGMDEYFENNKVIFWDINQNEIITLVDSTGGNQNSDYNYINKSLYRISKGDKNTIIEIISRDNRINRIELDSNFTGESSSRFDNHNMIVLFCKHDNISKEIMSKLGFNNNDSIKMIIIHDKGIKLFSFKELPSFSEIIITINNDSIIGFIYSINDDVNLKWNILNINSAVFYDGFEFFGTSYNSSNSNWGYKVSEDQNNLKSIDSFFDEIALTNKGKNTKKTSSHDIHILNTFNEVTSYKREIVNDSLLIIRNSEDSIIFENKFKLFDSRISKSKRYLIGKDSIIDLKTKNTIFLKKAIPCNQILNNSDNGSKVLEDTVNNLIYIIEQIPRKKRKQKYIYFNLKELSVNKIIHSFRIKNTYIETETAKDWRGNLTLGQDFNIDFKNKRIFLNEVYKNDFLNCYDFNSPDPIWSISGFEFFKLDSDGNILAKKEYGRNKIEIFKVNSQTGEILFKREFNYMNNFESLVDDPKNNQILIYQNKGSIISLNRMTGELNSSFILTNVAKNNHSSLERKFLCLKDYIITDGLDESTQIRSSSDGKLLYSFYDIPVINPNKESPELFVNNRLFIDSNYRFDGTPGAIEKLYFACGLEVVELNQIKDSLYVPNLVQRIMNGENLDHLPKLSELNICGVTPVVEPLENDKSGKQGYRIIPRSGGVGDVEVYINGVVRLSTNAKKLKRKDGNYMLYVEKELLELYQISGEETKVKVIAKTANNSISSRGVVIDIESDEKTTFKKPALHAIMIGVDDYKGDGLDLNYAAKDANDLQTVLQKSAQKFFNIDDTSRVHFYNLTVNRSGANGNEKIKGITPDRTNIINTIAEIEKTSKPEDILLLFFAGHGEIVDKDQLLLLTSESSREDFIGLRMRELLELLNKVPAGKRVLILDACHSGAAINNLDMPQLTGKRDVKDAERQSQRLKELDKLASKSGFAIITASSSDQKALELPQYEHGLMTYALLNAMLNNKSSLDENNQLQLDKWLMATEEEVRKLNQNQSAERMVPINFTLGKVDDEVRSSIVLKEIPLVHVSNVLNVDLGFDDQKIKSQLITYFSEKSRGTKKSLFVSEIEQPNSVQVNVVYSISKNQITLKATLLKNNEVVKRIEKSGNLTAQSSLLNELMLLIEKEVE